MNGPLKALLDGRRTFLRPLFFCAARYVTSDGSPGHVQGRGPIAARGVFGSREFPARNLVIGARGLRGGEFAIAYIMRLLSLIFEHRCVYLF